ncbi:MAG: response regulator transcription factor [Spirochaetaceae bacterium]|nr:response regulator transcription factor [Myxococcales bacterium]MCA9604006.1 response regulator transcription factor [Myxococcales bacterium]MCB9723663.1 response regulator transcription factor [Spirochaetaceae bacterium]
MTHRILVVDDEPDILELTRFALTREGYQVETASTGDEGLARMRRARPDLVVLDLMLPDVSGTEICRTMRGSSDLSGVPIIMLTARSDEVDRIVGFELGADDYVTKPFSPRELCLRVKAILRRGVGGEVGPEHLDHHGVTLDIDRHRCVVDDEEIKLTAKEFGLLASLMRRPGRVQTRERLLEEVWGTDINVTHRTVDTHMKRLREKLGSAGDLIDTVRGVGYRFRE